MIRFSKMILLLGTAVLALSACASEQGPGKIGTKEDIVVNNKGLPGAQQQQAAAAPADPSIPTSTVEQVEPIPAPEVAAAEPLPDNSPAMKQAVQEHQEAIAPVPSSTTPVSDTGDVKPIDSIAPTEPVNSAASTTPPAPQATDPGSMAPVTGSVSPERVYEKAASAPTEASPPVTQITKPGTVSSSVYAKPTPPPAPPAPAPQPVVSAAGPINYDTAYPTSYMKPSTSVAAAPSAPPVATTAAPMTEAGAIKAAQGALAAKGLYNGAQTGKLDSEFLNALILYQTKNKLPLGGLNAETMQSLGIAR